MRGTPLRGNAVSPRFDTSDKRSRRLSAPAATPRPGAVAASLTRGQEWVTTSSAAWRTAASAISFRIDTLPKGWQVVEASWAEEPVSGWVPIEPRGFVQICDLARARADTAAACEDEKLALTAMSPAPSKGKAAASPSNSAEKGYPQDTPSSAASTREALLALRQEHVRLREANVVLREREMAKRREIDGLCKTREAAAKELAQIQRDSAAEKEALKRCQQQRLGMQKKLERCREAVTAAVSSVDRIYSEKEGLLDLSGDEEESTQVGRVSAVEEATASGSVVAEMLLALAASPAKTSANADEQNSEEPSKSAYDKYTAGTENAVAIATPAIKKSDVVPGVPEVSADQRAPLRDLNRVR